ncbi:MAG: hypothetical protein R2685_04000 [Candidatus Nitrosocosmicus sp.]|nr:hypothetical protein [Candidatus Nitrosocosmicus sp.]
MNTLQELNILDDLSKGLLKDLVMNKKIASRENGKILSTGALWRLYQLEDMGMVNSKFNIKGDAGFREFYPTDSLLKSYKP